MRIEKIVAYYTVVLWLGVVMIVSCAPTDTPTPATRLGCSEGGAGMFTPADVRCHLDHSVPAHMQQINGETLVLLAGPEAIADWAGAAIIYHVPTASMLVLDRLGDVEPHASVFSSRAGLAALGELGGNPDLMAGLKQQLQLKWQTSPANEPEVRLSTAWQDGRTTIFFIAVAGLAATDDRLFCPGQRWTIGDNTEEIAPDCIAHQAGRPVNRLFFESKRIQGRSERPVQVALDGVVSNVVQVHEGPVAQETLIYQAVLQQLTNRPLIVRAETRSGVDEDATQLVEGLDASLLQNYLDVNETTYSLRFLFQDNNAYFVTPGAAITRDYLPDSAPQQACARFRSDYPGLGGIATLSGIGMSDDGSQALVHMLYECGPDDRLAAYYTLSDIDDGWQVTNTFVVATDLPALAPELEYVNPARGCGDIFVYKSNRAQSEYIKVWLDAKAFALSAEPITLDLATSPEAIGAQIDVYVDDVQRLGENPYCNDVGPTAVPRSVWQAINGTIRVTVSASVPAESCTGEPYLASVLMEDAVFALEEETVHLRSLLFEDVQVGWCPG